MVPTVREARYADAGPVAALTQRNGLASGTVSANDWSELWRENPVLQERPSLPIGWVLESDGRVAGYLGNIPRHYHLGGQRLLAAAARGMAVDVDQRRHSLRLVAAFFSQKGVDLLLNTTANAAAGAVFQLCKAARCPQPDCDRALFWIVDARGFGESALRKRGHGSITARAGSVLLGPALALEGRLRRRGRFGPAGDLELSVAEPRQLGDDFDAFWQRLLAARPGTLLADRSRQTLQWQFGRPGAAARHARVVCARRAGRITGYAVVTREDAAEIGLRRSRIVDLMAENNDPQVIDSLAQASFDLARASGSHVLESMGFPAITAEQLVARKPYARMLPAWPYWYYAPSADLRGQLQSPGAWHASAYDGDSSL